jgi:anti-sigma regulatory factor (Ser/Thr protein kinase)
MNTMALTRPTELHQCRVRLAAGPAAPARARGRVREAILAWDVPVNPDVAALLTSELVTNAVRHQARGTVTLAISYCRGWLRVDVHDSERFLPVVVDAAADDETGRGLMLVAALAVDWGFYRTPAGKAVYFALASASDLAESAGGPPPGVHAWGR